MVFMRVSLVEPLGLSYVRALRHVWQEARALPWVEEGGGTGRRVVKSFLSVPIIWWKSEVVVCSQDYFFRLVAPSSSAWSGGAISCTRCMVPQPFTTGGN
jgi:hypothetical protein